MRCFKKILVLLITITALTLSSFLLSSCDGTVTEGGIKYEGTTVVGTDGVSESLTIKDGTTAIKEGAFSGNTAIKSLIIPSSVNTIERGAFSGCEGITQVVDGVSYVDNWAIDSINTKEAITLREGTVGIAEEALSSLPYLKSLVIPDTVLYINSRALYGALALEEITLPFVGSAIDSTYSMHFGYIFGAFSSEKNSDYVPSTLKNVKVTVADKIYTRAFFDCSTIECITLPGTLTSIDGRAFEGCSSLKEIMIPDSVTAIGERAFLNCYALESVSLPQNEDFKTIEQFCFAYCKSLRAVEIPGSVDYIRACAFAVCESLEDIPLPKKTFELIGQQAFNGCKKLLEIEINAKIIERGAFRQCKRLKSITIGDCEKILGFAFEDCVEVRNITLPNSISYIGESIFKGCSLLENVNIPNQVEIIEAQSFLNCTSLNSLTIPDSVKAIDHTAFDGTPARIEITLDGITYIDGWVVDVDASLTEISLSADIRGICNNVFDDCRGLIKINYGGSATEWKSLIENSPNSQLEKVSMTYGKAE